MKVVTPEISWHERDPIYSVDFQPGIHPIQRLASGGVDKIVRIWQMTLDDEGKGSVEFLANLRRHTATVNVVRFSKNGELLASAGDDSSIILWKQSDVSAPANNIFGDDDTEDCKESWVCHKTLRGHLGDVADLSWSKDNRYLVSGSVDNSAIVWDIKKTQKLAFFNEHKSYVQGVAFDPLGDYVATLSSDRSLRIYSLASKNIINNVSKMPPISADGNNQSDTKPKPMRIFQDDSLRSFFRRLEFTCDGQLLLTPAGCVEIGDKSVSSSFVFVRGAFARPALYLPSGEKSTTVVRANPQLFELRKAVDSEDNTENKKEWEKHKSLFSLPYRMIYAVATEDSVLLYDTQQKMPVGLMKNIHYHQISDLSWSENGKALIICSTDGFCTIATFEEGELGVLYKEGKVSSQEEKASVSPKGSKVNAKVSLDDSHEESSDKEPASEIPFSRYSDTTQTTDSDNKKSNAKLNIRRVKKPTDVVSSGSSDSMSKEKEICADSKDDFKLGSESPAGEKKKAPGINSSLNIRRVPKTGTSRSISKSERKEPTTPESVSESPVRSGSDTLNGDISKKSGVNTVLNIKRIGNKSKSESSSKDVDGCKSNISEAMKTSDSAEEKSEAKHEVPSSCDQEKSLNLSEKVGQIHIEDVVMKDDSKTKETGEESSGLVQGSDAQIEDVIMLEECGPSQSQGGSKTSENDNCVNDQSSKAGEGQNKKRIQFTTLNLLNK